MRRCPGSSAADRTGGPASARYPLVLTCAKPSVFCQTQHRGLPSLRRRALDPEVELHPETAARARNRRGGLGERRDAGGGDARAGASER